MFVSLIFPTIFKSINTKTHHGSRIEELNEKKLIGKKQRMSFSANTTADLWKDFMPRRREIVDRAGQELYSVQLYPVGFFERFDPTATFEKWAAMEVSSPEHLPD